MFNTMLKYYTSVVLRGFTLLTKFIFIILLARFLQASDLGLYGLISAAVGYGIFVVGFEFYTYSTREIIKSHKENLFFILKNQVLFYLISYTLCIPVFIILVYLNILPRGSEYWFIALLFFEHLSQEINRVLITIESQTIASFILFVRQGLWCWLAIATMVVYPDLRNITIIFIYWLIGTVFACVLGVLCILNKKTENNTIKWDWTWLKKGIRLSAPMLIAALALRGFFTFDRFAIEKISGLEILGGYTLFVSMTSAIQSFLDTILISFSFPKLARLYSEQKYIEFKSELKKFALKLILLLSVLSICCFFTGYILLKWLNNLNYIKLFPVFILLILATFVYCISLIPHIALYAMREDHCILMSQCISFVTFISFLFMSVYLSDIYFVIIGMIVSFIILLLLKTLPLYNILNKVKC
ncbi:oligosaccharide flippase family protein [Salmonella enterica]|nr:oligosaccharide flippase family protein [Salmonella enterica]